MTITIDRLQIHPPVGAPPTLSFVAPGDLKVDESYQRSLEAESSVRLVRRMAANWNWLYCQPIQVARRADGSLWIVDGQHRHAAATLRRDIPFLPCVVSEFGTIPQEADAFVRINKERRALGSVDVFKADLAAGKPAAVEVAKLIEAAGLSIAPHQNYISWKPGMIYCVPGVSGAYRRYGAAVTSAGLNALSGSFEGQVLRYAGRLLRALFRFYDRHLKDPLFDAELFVIRLGLNSQEQWMRKCAEVVAATGQPDCVALTQAFEDAYRTAGGRGSFTTIDALTQKARSDLVWCDQCAKRKAPEDIHACTDRFCKVKAQAAA